MGQQQKLEAVFYALEAVFYADTDISYVYKMITDQIGTHESHDTQLHIHALFNGVLGPDS